MQNKVKISTGVLAVALMLGGGIGVGIAYAYNKPVTISQAAIETVKPIVEPIIDHAVDPAQTPPAAPAQTEWNGDSYPIPDDGKYHPSVHNPAGILVREITFHEGFRPKGLKALDVEVIARSANNHENSLNAGHDEIVSATGTSGKVYNMVGSKGTGVRGSYTYKAYSEERIIQYIDVDASEKGIVSVVLRHDGKNITLDAKDVKPIVTHP